MLYLFFRLLAILAACFVVCQPPRAKPTIPDEDSSQSSDTELLDKLSDLEDQNDWLQVHIFHLEDQYKALEHSHRQLQKDWDNREYHYLLISKRY